MDSALTLENAKKRIGQQEAVHEQRKDLLHYNMKALSEMPACLQSALGMLEEELARA